MLQPAGERQGVVNIRADDDATPDQVLEQYGPDAAQEVLQMKDVPTIYQDLAASICPSVFGHEQVKQAILLMLFGGVHKQTKEVSLHVAVELC
jgi:DNA replication licensing factor MCM6